MVHVGYQYNNLRFNARFCLFQQNFNEHTLTSTPGLALACLGLHADTDGLRLVRCRTDQCSHKGAADHHINGGSGTPGYLQFAFELLGAT